MRWWLRGENIYVAHNIDVGKAIRYVLTGLKQQVMYQVRVFGYSRGGDGLQSHPTLEFVLGEAQRSYTYIFTLQHYAYAFIRLGVLHCVDTVGWTSGRASGLQKIE